MKEPVYGFPCVDDPRDFTPDDETCTPEEIAAWKRDCEAAERGEYQRDGARFCTTDVDANGQLLRHVTRTPWGIGINWIAEGDEADE